MASSPVRGRKSLSRKTWATNPISEWTATASPLVAAISRAFLSPVLQGEETQEGQTAGFLSRRKHADNPALLSRVIKGQTMERVGYGRSTHFPTHGSLTTPHRTGPPQRTVHAKNGLLQSVYLCAGATGPPDATHPPSPTAILVGSPFYRNRAGFRPAAMPFKISARCISDGTGSAPNRAGTSPTGTRCMSGPGGESPSSRPSASLGIPPAYPAPGPAGPPG